MEHDEFNEFGLPKLAQRKGFKVVAEFPEGEVILSICTINKSRGIFICTSRGIYRLIGKKLIMVGLNEKAMSGVEVSGRISG
jgi:hypothetical protein